MPSRPLPTRWTEDDLARITKLGRIWGPVQPLGRTAVLREALKRCEEIEDRKHQDTKPPRKEKAK